jgi:hypothetical protein
VLTIALPLTVPTPVTDRSLFGVSITDEQFDMFLTRYRDLGQTGQAQLDIAQQIGQDASYGKQLIQELNEQGWEHKNARQLYSAYSASDGDADSFASYLKAQGMFNSRVSSYVADTRNLAENQPFISENIETGFSIDFLGFKFGQEALSISADSLLAYGTNYQVSPSSIEGLGNIYQFIDASGANLVNEFVDASTGYINNTIDQAYALGSFAEIMNEFHHKLGNAVHGSNQLEASIGSMGAAGSLTTIPALQELAKHADIHDESVHGVVMWGLKKSVQASNKIKELASSIPQLKGAKRILDKIMGKNDQLELKNQLAGYAFETITTKIF